MLSRPSAFISQTYTLSRAASGRRARISSSVTCPKRLGSTETVPEKVTSAPSAAFQTIGFPASPESAAVSSKALLAKYSPPRRFTVMPPAGSPDCFSSRTLLRAPSRVFNGAPIVPSAASSPVGDTYICVPVADCASAVPSAFTSIVGIEPKAKHNAVAKLSKRFPFFTQITPIKILPAAEGGYANVLTIFTY